MKVKQIIKILVLVTPVLLANLIAKQKVIITKTGVKMVLIPGGKFKMGDNKGKKNCKPEHVVEISPFYMDIYEVTQESYEKIIGNNPAKFEGMNRPVEQVRWYEAAKYCNERSKREGLTPVYNEKTWEANFNANGYRLPTEAEWEYAAKANSPQIKISKIKYYAWYSDNSNDKTQIVGKKKPNAFGLYDMLGNVWEWCNDWYKADYYQKSPKKDPKGPSLIVGKKVLRGGSWADRIKKISFTYRLSDDPANADICQGYDIYGFRCVRKYIKKK